MAVLGKRGAITKFAISLVPRAAAAREHSAVITRGVHTQVRRKQTVTAHARATGNPGDEPGTSARDLLISGLLPNARAA